MPTIDDVLAIVTVAFAVAAWVIPPVRHVLQSRRKARDSLVVVGRLIGMFVLAGLLSAAALVLALLTLAYSRHTGWGWFGLAVAAAYWILLATAAAVDDLVRWRRQRRRGGT